MTRKSLIRLASSLPKGSTERQALLEVLARGPVEITEAVSKQAPQVAWPNVTYKGADVFQAYIKVLGDAENMIWEAPEVLDDSMGGQEAYLGYSDKYDMFVSGWDWWDGDEKMGTAWVTLRMDGNRMRPMRAGFLDGQRLYGGGGLKKLKQEQGISHDLRLD